MISFALVSVLITAIKELIQMLLFAVGKGLCWIVGFLTDIFEAIAGLDTVICKGNGMSERKLLVKALFGSTNINTVFWGMALIGIVMCIGFAIVTVIKKSNDEGNKTKQSAGDLLRSCFKGVTLILLMNFIVSAAITVTVTLTDRINYLIVNAQSLDMSYDMTFDSDDYAAMARSLNTIGNYSLNASYNSRCNLNSCYNNIRGDLEHLAEKGKFDVTYITTVYDEQGNCCTVNTWQSVLQGIYRSVDDITVPQPMDEYNTKLSEALLEAMDVIKNDASFAALEKYRVNQAGQDVGEAVSLDRMIMLLGSMYGKGGSLTKGSGFTDFLRAPYYYGQKDLFSYSTCEKDFDMSLGTWLYLAVIVVAFLFVKEMLAMLFNAAVRILNILLLYAAVPPITAAAPLDEGGKLKQWTTAFFVQSLGFFGTVISLRLVMMFIPVLFSGDIQFFGSVRADILAKVVIMFAAIFTARKASDMIAGTLADNAAVSSASEDGEGKETKGAANKGLGIVKALRGTVLRAMGSSLDTVKMAYGKGSAEALRPDTESSSTENMTSSGSGSAGRKDHDRPNTEAEEPAPERRKRAHTGIRKKKAAESEPRAKDGKERKEKRSITSMKSSLEIPKSGVNNLTAEDTAPANRPDAGGAHLTQNKKIPDSARDLK